MKKCEIDIIKILRCQIWGILSELPEKINEKDLKKIEKIYDILFE